MFNICYKTSNLKFSIKLVHLDALMKSMLALLFCFLTPIVSRYAPVGRNFSHLIPMPVYAFSIVKHPSHLSGEALSIAFLPFHLLICLHCSFGCMKSCNYLFRSHAIL